MHPMREAIPTDTTPVEPLPPPTRRGALAALGWTATAALSGAVLSHGLADAAEAFTPSPDADLIRACGEYVATLDAITASDGVPDDDPLWAALDRPCDVIVGTKATTLEGLIAKAKAAKCQAMTARGGECADGMPEEIAWAIVNDLVPLASGRAV